MKILIVGAGPVGCYLARLLKKKKILSEITVIEEHAEIGRPIHCAGLVSKDTLSEIKIDFTAEGIIINHIDGAEFFLEGDSFRINRQSVALVIDRAKFDQALGAGVDIDFNTRFVGIEKNDSGYLVETDKREYYADVVIGADGANSAMRKAIGVKEEIELLRGVQFRIRYEKCDDNFVQVYFKKPFFAWVISERKGIVRAGIISNNPYHDLLAFLEETGIKGEILEKFAGIVPLGNCETRKGNLFLVGDAACQVKPLSHGGIYYGMRCAEVLADCIAQEQLGEYDVLWRKRFQREIDIALKIKKLYQHLSEKNVEKIFGILKKNAKVLEEFGDFENHSKVISVFFRNPQLQSVLGKILINMIKEINL